MRQGHIKFDPPEADHFKLKVDQITTISHGLLDCVLVTAAIKAEGQQNNVVIRFTIDQAKKLKKELP
jgi:hypothetical protein